MAYEAHAGGSRPGDNASGRVATPPVTAVPGAAARTTTVPRSPGPAKNSPAPEWAVQALDRVDEIVDKVRTNTTDRLVRIARVVVFGLLAVIMGTTAAVLGVIGLVRGLDELLPGPVWSVYVLLGAIFTVAGAFLWSKKTARPAHA
ncbi:MAG: hypothetical protein ACR2LJ_06275 [Acidimicrobiales bacterium]